MLLSFHLDTKDGHALNSLFGFFQTTSSKPIYSLEQKIIGMHHTTWRLRINKNHSNQFSELNIHLDILQTTSSNQYIVSSRNLMGCVRQHGDSEYLKSSRTFIKNGHALNSHLEFLQTTSSKPYVFLGKALMVGISQLSQMLKSLHSDTNDGHALSSLHGILQTTSSKLNALLRLIIAKIFPFGYQRWPWTKQPTCNSSNNIFKPIFSLEQKTDGSLQGKLETQICLNHSIQISKMAIH